MLFSIIRQHRHHKHLFKRSRDESGFRAVMLGSAVYIIPAGFQLLESRKADPRHVYACVYVRCVA